MGKKKESRGKQQKGFLSKRSSRTDSQDNPAGSSVVSLNDDSPSGELAPALSRSSWGGGGDLRLGNSSVPSQRSHGTTGSKADSGSSATLVPPPPDPTKGIWMVSMGFRLQPLTLRLRLSVRTPPPGDPTLSTLSQGRSSRSGSKRPVDRPSSDRSDRSATKGSTGNRSHRVLVTPVTLFTGYTGCTGQTGQTGCTNHTGSTGSSGHTSQHQSKSSRGSGYSAPGPV